MAAAPSLPLVVLFFGTILYKFFLYPIFLSPLARIPNAHPLAPITSAWILWVRYKGRENRAILEAHNKYGSVVRLAPDELSVNCVENGIRTIYAGGFEKHEWYPRIFHHFEGVHNMFSTAFSKPHSERKRLVSNVWSKSYIQSSPAMAVISPTMIYTRMLPRLQDHATSGKDLDIYEFFSAVTMDFVTAFQFGLANASNFTTQPEAFSHFLHDLFYSRREYAFYAQELPGLTSLLQRLGIKLVPDWVSVKNRQLETWTLNMCDGAATSTIPSPQSRSDPLDKSAGDYPSVHAPLLSGLSQGKTLAPASPSKDGLTSQCRLEAASEMLDNLAAGFDTSGITLTYLCHELSTRPSLQAQLRQELLSLDPHLTFSLPRTRTAAHTEREQSLLRPVPSARHLDALPLLHAILQETLRLHPAIPGPQPRVTPARGCRLGPYTDIPGGIRVSASAGALHRNPDVFPEPGVWKPERWMETRPGWEGRRREMLRWFWAWGSGGRMCVGRNLAELEMKLIVAALYTNFTTRIVDDKGIEQADAYTAPPSGGRLIVKVEPVQ